MKTYHYPNTQEVCTLWYHDHRHLVTAQNVYSGMAAFYPISDVFEQAQLPQGEFDVPLMVSDAEFNANGCSRSTTTTPRACGETSSWSTGWPGRR